VRIARKLKETERKPQPAGKKPKPTDLTDLDQAKASGALD